MNAYLAAKYPVDYQPKSYDYFILRRRFKTEASARLDADKWLYPGEEHFIIETMEDDEDAPCWLWCTHEDFWLLELPRRKLKKRIAKWNDDNYARIFGL